MNLPPLIRALARVAPLLALASCESVTSTYHYQESYGPQPIYYSEPYPQPVYGTVVAPYAYPTYRRWGGYPSYYGHGHYSHATRYPQRCDDDWRRGEYDHRRSGYRDDGRHDDRNEYRGEDRDSRERKTAKKESGEKRKDQDKRRSEEVRMAKDPGKSRDPERKGGYNKADFLRDRMQNANRPRRAD